ncbi:hypothetical protein EV2_018443 [Malus domestica]
MGGGEYTSAQFKAFLTQHGIHHRLSYPHHPEQNGLAKRKHRHIVDTGLTLMAQASMAPAYWAEAMHTTTSSSPNSALEIIGPLPCVHLQTNNHIHTHHILPSTSESVPPNPTTHTSPIPNSPRQMPSLSQLVPPNPTLLTLPLPNPTSPLPNSSSAVLSTNPAAPPHNSTTQSSLIPNPNAPAYLQVYHRKTHRPTGLAPFPVTDLITHTQPVSPSSSRQPHFPATSSVRATNAHPMVTRSKAGNLKSKCAHYADYFVPTNTFIEPTCFSQANKIHECRQAIADEFNALQRARTWVIVPRTQSMNILPNKWVFRIKRNFNGSIQRFKARLVANGFHQQPGLNYGETFSPVVNHSTIRLILALSI